MPTQKFLNLNEYKRRVILDSMRDELLHSPYSEIAVSRIVKKANISRASFYLYFQGKEDLLYCMLYQEREDLQRKLMAAFKEEKGSFYNSMRRTFRTCLEDGVGKDYCRIFRRILDDEECKDIALKVESEFYNRLLKSGGLVREQLIFAFDMGLWIIFRAVLMYYEGNSDMQELEEAACKQLIILERGIQAQMPEDRKGA